MAKLVRNLIKTISVLFVSVTVLGQKVVINEIMYRPATGNLLESYVELYNPDSSAIDLSGWKFTKGIDCTLPPGTSIGPGGFLVVAADATAFARKYPSVTNFVTGWSGTMGGHLRLEDTSARIASEVSFSNDGDWATRVLTTNGFASYGHAGWEWTALHDGGGSSLELVNADLSESYALNWGPSTISEGTPGRANSIASTNAAPIITAVSHSPIVPRSTDVVTVSARIVDKDFDGLSVTLHYRDATGSTPTAFSSAPMWDDGQHNDGLAGDGVYAAILPARVNGAVVEFYLQAQNRGGNLRTYPQYVSLAGSPRTANLLYQVDNGVYTGNQPIYRVVMTELERSELYRIGRGCPDSDSDAQMNGTWITSDGVMANGTTTQLRYNVGIRNRGHGTRQSNPNNYHVNIPGDRPWKNLTGINLNSQYAYSQLVGSAVFRLLGVPMAESRAVQVRINSTNLMALAGLPDNNSFGSYAANEQYNADFIQRAYPLDPHGNSYRGIRDSVLCDPTYNGVADLTWHGAAYAVGSYTNAYYKQNHLVENDWSDLIDLIAVLNSTNGYQASNYISDVRRRLDVEEWMRYMAVNTLLDNDETCLANGVGDDYALYRGSKDTRFQALPYDLDTVMGRGNAPVPPRHSIFRMNALPAMDRFMKTPEFAPVYYRWLKTLADTSFAPAQMNPLLDQLLNAYVPQATIETMKAFNAAQVSYVLSQIPLSLVVTNSLALQNGYPRTTIPSVALTGGANAIDTRRVLVNGADAAWVAWQGTWSSPNVPLNPGVNRVLVQALGTNNVEIDRSVLEVWYDDGNVQTVGGAIAGSVIWTAEGGPYQVNSTLTVKSGSSLTIEAGTSIYMGSEVSIVVTNGGRLVAEGTASAPIRFGPAPGTNTSWGGITINGVPNSPETSIAYAHFEGNGKTCIEVAGGTLSLDHATFGTTTHQYLSLDNSSFLLSSCVFPTSSAPFELVHGTGGIKAGGRGIVRECFFGTTSGYNDIMDFTGGNRDLNQPIIQYYNNVFIGGSDDGLDLDGTDAWIEGNIFLHVHKNGAPDSSSAISGGSYDFGADGGVRTSQITLIGNLFFDCDQAATAKQGNFFTLINNTIVHMTKTGGLDTAAGVVNVRDLDPGPPTTFGAGFYLEGNIIVDTEQLVRNYDATQTAVTFNGNILPYAWTGPGEGNLIADPLLKHIPTVDETQFNTWEQAQVLRDWFSLQPGSPAVASGPNGRDQGGVIPLGASISGEPTGTTAQTNATLRVGVVRSGNGIPTAGWPNGSGYTHYKWRLDGGAWSAETSVAVPITLTALDDGTHHVEVTGKRDSGWYQDAVELGSDAIITTSRWWVVDTSYLPPVKSGLRINEILALNATTVVNGGATPDLVELYNAGSQPVELAGLGFSDDATRPSKFIFPAGTGALEPGQYLVVYGDNQTSLPGIHLGFGLKASGEGLYLYDKLLNGGGLLDSVNFGPQISDFSIGRAEDGTWVLCEPTFGAKNRAAALGDARHLKINEWLTDEMFLGNNDFVELYNPDPRPVALGGCFLSNAEGAFGLNPIAGLSFIAPHGQRVFIADATPSQGPNHLNFKLDADVGIILLSDPALEPIDLISYGPQRTDVAEGRSPSGSDTLVEFAQPTPGGPNPGPAGGASSVTNITFSAHNLLEINSVWRYDNSGTDRGTAWSQISFNDAAWPQGVGLFGSETTPSEYPYPFLTPIPPPDKTGGHITVYYRTHFQWDGSLTNSVLVSTNYVDDGAVYYLNGVRAGALRLSGTVTYGTLAGSQNNEGVPEILVFTNAPALGDNVMAVEVHQVNATSSDDVFGMQLSAVQFTTNIITTTTESLALVLNEVSANSHVAIDPDAADWAELFNTGTNAVDLGDVSLTDDPNFPRKYVFAGGSVIPAGGFFVVACDPSTAPSATNTGFALSAKGGSLFLFQRLSAGGGLVDAVSYGLQPAGFSIGRLPNGSGAWGLNSTTPAAPNQAAGLGNVSNLQINEWMANPSGGSDWFELYNSGSQPVALGLLSFTDTPTETTLSPLPSLSFIGSGPDAFLVFQADGNRSAGADHVNFKLSKSGETIGLYAPGGTLVTAVAFGAQSKGISQGRFPDGATNVVSFSATASPGSSNYLPVPDLVVNEVLTRTDSPYENAVEFYNAGATQRDIGGWFLSNSSSGLKKYRIADGTIVPARGFIVFYEYQFNSTNGANTPFSFNSALGDEVQLSEALGSGELTGHRASGSFGASADGVSFGRYTNSIGAVDLVAMAALSFGVNNPTSLEQFRTGTGAPNSHPLVGPLVINEIMYQPAAADLAEDNLQDEYLEFINNSTEPLSLFDPAAPTNTWTVKGGIDFTFPQGITVQGGALVLLVNFDPVADVVALAEFRTRYGVDPSVALFGPYAGHLANLGEGISLYRPDSALPASAPGAGYVPHVLVERIDYQPGTPWPGGANGTGFSLQRRDPSSFGNDPANWFAAAPTAGGANTATSEDSNKDGLPDSWQIQYFGSITDPRARPDADPDGDGSSNIQEYQAGTSPVDAQQYLRIDSVEVSPGAVTIQFLAQPNRTYSVLFSTDLVSGEWSKLSDVAAQAQRGAVTVTDSSLAGPSTRFYRLVTPRAPSGLSAP